MPMNLSLNGEESWSRNDSTSETFARKSFLKGRPYLLGLERFEGGEIEERVFLKESRPTEGARYGRRQDIRAADDSARERGDDAGALLDLHDLVLVGVQTRAGRGVLDRVTQTAQRVDELS